MVGKFVSGVQAVLIKGLPGVTTL